MTSNNGSGITEEAEMGLLLQGLILLLEIHSIKLNGSRKESKNIIPWKPEKFKVDLTREKCVFISGLWS